MMKCFDIQINGAFGTDFSDPGLSAENFVRCSEKILNAGVSRFLPTVVTSPWTFYQTRLPLLAEALDKAGLQYEIPGFHLEGPFISKVPGAVGAHNPDWVREPSPGQIEQLQEWAGGKIRLMTFAAEYPSARESIARAKELGITASLGHHLADERQIASAGASALTHLGNGCPNMLDRHRNPIWSGLANDDLTALVIADGHHLPANVIKCFFRCKTAAKICVISDASPVAGLPPGCYRIWGNDSVLEPWGLLHNPVKKCLVGSSALLPQCMEFLQSLNLVTQDELELCCWKNQHRLLHLPETE